MQTIQDHAAIEKLIFYFGNAFNAANVQQTVASFTPDGINMPNNAPPAQGTDNLTKAFGFLFNMAAINIEYQIDEVVVNGDYAFARTHSTVTTVVKANNDRMVLENKELFVFRIDNGDWKISHYIFNNTKTTR